MRCARCQAEHRNASWHAQMVGNTAILVCDACRRAHNGFGLTDSHSPTQGQLAVRTAQTEARDRTYLPFTATGQQLLYLCVRATEVEAHGTEGERLALAGQIRELTATVAPPAGRTRAAVEPPAPTKPVVTKAVAGGLFEADEPPAEPMASIEVACLDTETTGIERDANVIELAVCIVEIPSGRIIEKRASLISPVNVPVIPPGATAIHGITRDKLVGKPRFREMWPRVLAFIGRRPVVAHNASFDRDVIHGELTRAGLARPGLPLYCSLKLARRVLPKPVVPNHKLPTLATYLHVPMPTHRASADTVALAGVVAGLVALGGAPLEKLHGKADTL